MCCEWHAPCGFTICWVDWSILLPHRMARHWVLLVQPFLNPARRMPGAMVVCRLLRVWIGHVAVLLRNSLDNQMRKHHRSSASQIGR